MNKKVWIGCIYLLWIFLVAFALLKLFFAEAFAAGVSNPKIAEIGAFIDGHLLVSYIAYLVPGYFTYFCFLCACSQKWNLTWKEHVAVLVWDLFINVVFIVSAALAQTIDVVFMVVMPIVIKSNYKQFVSVFVVHYIGQLLILLIRGVPLQLVGVDFATQFIIVLDSYVWLLL